VGHYRFSVVSTWWHGATSLGIGIVIDASVSKNYGSVLDRVSDTGGEVSDA
jgi:hypothetical protein